MLLKKMIVCAKPFSPVMRMRYCSWRVKISYAEHVDQRKTSLSLSLAYIEEFFQSLLFTGVSGAHRRVSTQQTFGHLDPFLQLSICFSQAIFVDQHRITAELLDLSRTGFFPQSRVAEIFNRFPWIWHLRQFTLGVTTKKKKNRSIGPFPGLAC